VSDDIHIDLGSGSDKLTAGRNHSEDFTVYGGTGKDYVDAYSNVATDRFYANLGSGNDTLDLNGNRADRHYLHGDSGDDTLNASGWNWFWLFDAHSF
jgi:Ca2+-binding RTX toxin-like protein